MNKRTTIIVIISIAVILVISLAIVSTATLAYFAIQARPNTILTQNNSATYNESDGIIIASVEPGSPADQAGVVRGDILLEIDDTAITYFTDLVNFLEGYHSSDQIEISVLHGDELRILNATLDERDGSAYLGITTCGGPRERLPIFEQPLSSGVIITEVIADSPAEGAGLQTGEWIISIDGEEVNAESDLAKMIEKYQPGDTIDIEISTPGEDPTVVQVTLGEHPDDIDRAYLGIFYHPGVGLRGFDKGRIPFNLPEQLPNIPFLHSYELPEGDINGAIITEVLADSPAEIAKLMRNDIITAIDGNEIKNPSELTKSIQSYKPGDEVSVTIFRPGEKEALQIEVTLGSHPELTNTAYLGVNVAHFMKSIDPKQQENFDFLPKFENMPFFKDLPFFDKNNSESPHQERLLPGGST